MKRALWRRLVLVLILVGFTSVVIFQQNPILDWATLRGYAPPSEIAVFAERTAMTDRAKHLLYINKPLLDDRNAFNEHCTSKAEQTVVLGCYLGNRNGIFIYNVTDAELNGVREVTTAHEMLHQAYDRLSPGERDRINELLEKQAVQITDEDIRSQIDTYKKTEPASLSNELHSLFGTQLGDLPKELETYYAQYFTDRSKVVELYNAYRSAFTTRKNQITTYDAQLKQLKPVIDALQDSVERQLVALDQMKATMSSRKNAGDISGYNSMVPQYNTSVTRFNADLDSLEQKITTYNDIVNRRNAIADQEQALQRSLSSKSLPDAVE